MFDWIWNADLWIKMAGIATAALGLFTAVVSFKKNRATEGSSLAPRSQADLARSPTSGGGLRLISLSSEPTAPPWWQKWEQKSWKKYAKVVVIILGSASAGFTVLALLLSIQQQSSDLLFPLFFFGGCTLIYVLFGMLLWSSQAPVSHVKRQQTLKIQGDRDKLWDEAIAALKRMNVDIKTVDSNKGLIEGQTRNYEILTVQVCQTAPAECDVNIQSDSMTIMFIKPLYDFGRNARNVRKFVQELLR